MKDIDKALSSHVSDAKARIEKPTGQSIGIKGKKFSYKNEVIGKVQAGEWFDEGQLERVEASDAKPPVQRTGGPALENVPSSPV